MPEISDKHHRTNLFGSAYLKDPTTIFTKKVLVTGNEVYLKTSNGILTIKTLVNLTCRYLDKIYLEIPQSLDKLSTELEKIVLDTNSEIIFSKPKECDIVISVGNIPESKNFTITIGSDGWVSFLACNNRISSKINSYQNPIGAMGASVFGSAEVFKRILEISGCKEKWTIDHPSNYTFSFLDYSLSQNNSNFPNNIELLEEIILVGAGAVGSSFTYAISSISNVSGNITTIDNESFDVTNLNRCLICYNNTIGTSKSEVTTKYSTKTLKFSSFVGTFRDYIKKFTHCSPIVISTVDNNEARFQIQSELPKLIFHGATGKNISAISTIKLLENACLGCIFENNSTQEEIISIETGIPLPEVKRLFEKDDIFSEVHFHYMKKRLGDKAEKFSKNIGQKFSNFYVKEVCGQITAETSEGTKTPSVSFVSFFSGLVLTSELVKFHSSDLKEIPMLNSLDFLQFNLFIPTLYHIVRRPKNPNCLINCSSTNIQEVFAEKWNLKLIKNIGEKKNGL